MSGMGSVLQITNPVVVAAFRSALLHQGIIALLIFFLLALLWVSLREWIPSSRGPGRALAAAAGGPAEPRGRRLLRISFGILWILDGILQVQPAMPLGLPSQVTQPAAAGSPIWVQHLVDWGARGWSYHPIAAAAAAVWIQVGIGIWLLTAARGPASRLGGLASVGWGLLIWIFGEAFGGVLAPGLTWLFGAPGAALCYAVAGLLVALPDRAWLGPRLGRLVLGAMGLFFTGMAVLQAWPGRGYWQGTIGRQPGSLTSMIQGMAQTPQPGFLSSWVTGFGSFTAAHGFAVNLVAVVTLGAIGVALLTGPPRVLRPALVVMALLCLADWVLIEDLGIFGGLGTDPNSMIPLALVTIGGYLALTQAAAPASAAEPAVAPVTAVAPAAEPAADSAAAATRTPAAEPAASAVQAAPAEPSAPADQAVPAGSSGPADQPDPAGQSGPGWRGRIGPRRLGRALGAASPRTVAALGALGVAILGVVPMAAASASTSADPIIAEAIDGSSAALNFRAPAFDLTDQHGQPVSLAGLHGKVVLLTFLDPVCTSDCPIIAQEFRKADQMLGANAGKVELVAIATNPIYYQLRYTQAFDREQQLTGLTNWRYLTGPLPQLRQVWKQYSIAAQILPAGGMIGHTDVAYIIGKDGRTRTELNFDPGPGTASSTSSFAGELYAAAQQALDAQ